VTHYIMKRLCESFIFCTQRNENSNDSNILKLPGVPSGNWKNKYFRIKYTFGAFLFFMLACVPAVAQKPFTEGVIVYNVTLVTTDHGEYKGVYTFTIKGSEIKKELKLNNGYDDIVVLNCGAGTVYTLQSKNGKKYMIQLSISDLEKRQEKYLGFTVSNEQINSRNIAGFSAAKGNIQYKDGANVEVYYTKEWNPVQRMTYERFPDAKFLPVSYYYKDETGAIMHFDAEKIEARPVENSVFRAPADYKMISYKEYKELSQ